MNNKLEQAIDYLMSKEGCVWCNACEEWAEAININRHVHDVHTTGHNSTNDCCHE